MNILKIIFTALFILSLNNINASFFDSASRAFSAVKNAGKKVGSGVVKGSKKFGHGVKNFSQAVVNKAYGGCTEERAKKLMHLIDQYEKAPNQHLKKEITALLNNFKTCVKDGDVVDKDKKYHAAFNLGEKHPKVTKILSKIGDENDLVLEDKFANYLSTIKLANDLLKIKSAIKFASSIEQNTKCTEKNAKRLKELHTKTILFDRASLEMSAKEQKEHANLLKSLNVCIHDEEDSDLQEYFADYIGKHHSKFNSNIYSLCKKKEELGSTDDGIASNVCKISEKAIDMSQYLNKNYSSTLSKTKAELEAYISKLTDQMEQEGVDTSSLLTDNGDFSDSYESDSESADEEQADEEKTNIRKNNKNLGRNSNNISKNRREIDSNAREIRRLEQEVRNNRTNIRNNTEHMRNEEDSAYESDNNSNYDVTVLSGAKISGQEIQKNRETIAKIQCQGQYCIISNHQGKYYVTPNKNGTGTIYDEYHNKLGLISKSGQIKIEGY